MTSTRTRQCSSPARRGLYPSLFGLSLVLAFMIGLDGQGEARGQETVVVITQDQCQELTRHRPEPDVAYQPGVDLRGRPVAPADLGGGVEITLPQRIRIAIEADLFERRGIPRNGKRYEPIAEIGAVEVELEDGRASFNGQPLQNDAQAELAARCQEILREGE